MSMRMSTLFLRRWDYIRRKNARSGKMPDVPDFPAAFKSRRIELHLLQRDVAELCDVTQSTISKWEAGKELPGVDNYAAVAKFLRLKIEQVADLVTEPPDDLTEIAARLHQLVDELIRVAQVRRS